VNQLRGVVMRVLALNGSPTSERGATFGVLSLFLKGMENAGAEVDLVHVSKLKVGPCRGCFTCWTKTPGECIQRDDMDDLLPKMDNADITVFATPVFVDGMTGQLKTVIDRSIPLDSGKVVLKDDHCRHPRRSGKEGGKVVLVSVCGFQEIDNFNPLVAHVKAICKNMGTEYVGAILRPYAWAFSHADQIGIDVSEIIDAVGDAGRQIIENGKFNDTTIETIQRQVLSKEIVAQIISSQFQ